jgi:endogenous inhibitor of DNA gyrase (YacG/DUF329 family)
MSDDQRTLFDGPGKPPKRTYTRGQVETPCKQCGKPVIGCHARPRVFCSRECQGAHRSETREGAKPKQGKMISCALCGAEFYVHPGAGPVRKYCSRECSYKGLNRQVTIQCETCGREFQKAPSMAGKFCSVDCYLASRDPGKSCEVCGKPLTASRLTFCSPECSAKAQRTGAMFPCETCGKEFYISPQQLNKRFCSRKCLHESRRLKGAGYSYVRQDGYIAVYYPNHPDASARGLILEHRLVAEEKYGRRILRTEHVHHLNGVRDDNRPENIELIDPGDHARISNQSGAEMRAAMKAELEAYRRLYGPLPDSDPDPES